MRDGLLAMGVLNNADPGVSSDNTDAVRALAELPHLGALRTTITRRKAFPNAAGFGLSVEELAPLDPKSMRRAGGTGERGVCNGRATGEQRDIDCMAINKRAAPTPESFIDKAAPAQRWLRGNRTQTTPF